MVIKNRLLLPSITSAAAVIGTISLLFFLYLDNNNITNQRYDNNDTSFPVLRSPYDESLKIQLVAKGLSHPTSMAFVGGRAREGGREVGENNANNILVTEKNGTLRLISGGLLNPQPVLKLNVNALAERGLLGVAAAADTTAVTNTTNTTTINHDNSNNNKRDMGTHSTGNNSSTSNSNDGGINLVSNKTDADTHAYDKKYDIFLYYTQAEPLRNRVYEYQWNGKENTKLVNPKLILDLPAKPGPYHQGGKLKLSQDNKFLYTVIGDLTSPNTKLQNNKHGKNPYDTSVILKMNLNNISSATSTIHINMTGQASSSSSSPLPHINGGSNLSNNNNGINNNNNTNNNNSNYSSYYFAYGIRNSFGLAIDPLTGNLWDTENGEDKYDEINLVKPGFNSGWIRVMGPISRNDNSSIKQQELVNFPGSKYADPVFSWKHDIGITDIEFLNSSKLGNEYKNNIFVGDINYGNLYYFEVNGSRTGVKISPKFNAAGLADLVADDSREASPTIFGSNFGRITDIETGPDGFLYILSYDEGKIYRIVPS